MVSVNDQAWKLGQAPASIQEPREEEPEVKGSSDAPFTRVIQ